MTLTDLYARVPALACKQLPGCTDMCGAIGCTQTERDTIEAASGKRLAALKVIQPNGWRYKCTMQDAAGNCTVYEVRPLICRLWGTVKSMRCPNGCNPSKLLSTRAGHALIREATRIGGPTVYSVIP